MQVTQRLTIRLFSWLAGYQRFRCKRYKQMSLTSTDDYMPEKLVKAIANPLFLRADSKMLRSGKHVSTEDLDNHALLSDFGSGASAFLPTLQHGTWVKAPSCFFICVRVQRLWLAEAFCLSSICSLARYCVFVPKPRAFSRPRRYFY